MVSLLLAIIYLAFISLGLPDSLLGSGWPVMHRELAVPISYAGMISMIISGGTIVSSLMSDRLTRRLGTGVVTVGSVFLTAAGLFGFSMSGSFWLLCVCAVPYGLGAGAIDAALNNFVALHYNSRQMSWLHCFWGVGASISPYIMGYALGEGLGWRSGYRMISVIQIVLTVVLFLSLPLWKCKTGEVSEKQHQREHLSLAKAVKIKGVALVLVTFFSYCAFESTCGLWISSYFADYRGMEKELAASFAAFFFLGITFGRFVTGFFADKVGDRGMIRLGFLTALAGVGLLMLPYPNPAWAFPGLLIVGIGAAPVYPAIIHSTPDNFGKENFQAIIGIQMASAYVGSTFMPPVFGLLAEHVSIALYPFYLAVFLIFGLVMSEKLNRTMKKEKDLHL